MDTPDNPETPPPAEEPPPPPPPPRSSSGRAVRAGTARSR